jgi:tungstate transport system ATP-binding protein
MVGEKSPVSAVLEMDGVTKDYDGKAVLQSATIKVFQGETLALVGPSGSGKTTLLRLAMRAITPTSGTIRLFGAMVESGNAGIERLRRASMVYQRPVLMSATVRENVAYGLRVRGRPVGAPEIDRILERLRLSDLRDRHAAGLSGGERQRVALARALILRPELLLLDEPTSHLEPAGVRLVEEVLRELRAENHTAVVIATHNVHQARRIADRTALIWEGRMIEEAPSERFFSAPEHEKTRAFLRGDLIY